MQVLIGKNSGFCFGVKRAVDTALSLKRENTFVLGEVIHNDIVNKQISDAGITTIESINDERLKPNSTLLIRTHGEAQSVFNYAKQKNINIIDCTCPFVKDIQKIVNEHFNKGYKIAIIGQENHPEIIGINGWCDNSAIITTDIDVLNNIIAEKLCIVVQTTFSKEKYELIIKNFNNSNVKSVDIFNTICYTTKRRQLEAQYISKNCDAVLVVGGAKSNNTNNLFNICSENCKNVYRLFDTFCFNYENLKNFNKVGIVLGASTPQEQAREVISNMANITEDINTMDVASNEETDKIETTEIVNENATKSEKKSKPKKVKTEMQSAFDNIRPTMDFKIGQVVVARISSATEQGLTLSIKNAKIDFELLKEEMINEYNKDDYKDKINSEIRVMVVGKKPLKFSEKAMEKVLKEEAEIEEIKNGKIFESVITETNKGGLIGKYGSYQVFVPASQIRLGFVKDLDKYIGKTIRLKAEKVESRGARRQIVGSQRVILEVEKQERDAIKAAKEAEFFENIQEGDVVLGTPVRFTNFGAFVEVNGFDCLAHISDLSWTGCSNCSEILEIGKTYEFKILKIDVETKRVSVGYKQLQPKPWDSVPEKYHVGDVIKGKVVRIVSFGAFVEVEKGIDGLVHVSQISNKWLENPVTAVQVGQEVDAKIIDINVEKEKMTLSIKALLPEEEKPADDKKKKVEKEEPVEEELHEWKDEGEATVSIADYLSKQNN